VAAKNFTSRHMHGLPVGSRAPPTATAPESAADVRARHRAFFDRFQGVLLKRIPKKTDDSDTKELWIEAVRTAATALEEGFGVAPQDASNKGVKRGREDSGTPVGSA
jgi:hypothetical protein